MSRTVLVSVLDLDNIVRFGWQTSGGPRKQSMQTLASPRRDRHQTEISHLLMAIKRCCCYFKIALKVTCISLYDVNRMPFLWNWHPRLMDRSLRFVREQTSEHSANARRCVLVKMVAFSLLLRSNCQACVPFFERNLVEPRRIELLTS